MLNPPAMAESIENPTTETILKNVFLPRRNPSKTNDGNHTQTFPATTETINKPTTETIKTNKTLDDVDDGNHNKNVLTVSMTN